MFLLKYRTEQFLEVYTLVTTCRASTVSRGSPSILLVTLCNGTRRRAGGRLEVRTVWAR